MRVIRSSDRPKCFHVGIEHVLPGQFIFLLLFACLDEKATVAAAATCRMELVALVVTAKSTNTEVWQWEEDGR